MRSIRLAIVLSCLLASSLVVAPARADDQMDLELATNRYKSGQYDDAAERFAKLLGAQLDPSAPDYRARRRLRRRARPLYAATLIGLARLDEADAVILTHLRDKPRYQPAPGEFPNAVMDRFVKVRRENKAELDAKLQAILERERAIKAEAARVVAARKKRLATLERMASEVEVVETRSRVVAAVPFGVGQFYNGDVALGAVFLSTEVLAASASIVSAALGLRYSDALHAGQADLDRDAVQDRYDTAKVVNWASFGTTLGLVAAGVIQAQVAFEGSRTSTRKRPIPPRIAPKPTAAPTLAAGPGGFVVGVGGTF